MSPIHADIRRYGIPFSVPVLIRGLRVERREGLLLRLMTADGGAVAIGEVAPLPGLHDETLDEAERSLTALIPKIPALIGCPVPELRARVEAEGLPPSVATGVEMAVLNFLAARTGALPPFPESSAPASPVPVNALLDGAPDAVLEKAAASFSGGFRAFKLKVRPGRTSEALACIQAFHRIYRGRAELRLDANQSLGLDEAVEFGRSIPAGSVAYIEEPLMDASQIHLFHERTGILSALDETLWQCPGLMETIPAKALGALVLKPNRIGGLMKSLELAGLAARLGIPAVFSSAFETGVSLGMYALMAAISSREPAASGLDTISFLEYDLPVVAFSTSGGSTDPVAAWRNGQRLREELLEPHGSWIL
ncbi:MAG: o-succinylbenzoate synthase [Chlorobiaceae bacterium]|nr:o-succinylbenzoate synthase [Chlorobiaceae bacterium]